MSNEPKVRPNITTSSHPLLLKESRHAYPEQRESKEFQLSTSCGICSLLLCSPPLAIALHILRYAKLKAIC
jgi:hypothetical protein